MNNILNITKWICLVNVTGTIKLMINKLSITSIILGLSFLFGAITANAASPVLIRPFGDSITFGVGMNNYCAGVQGMDQKLCWPPSITGGGYRGFMTLYSIKGDGITFTTEGYRSDGSIVMQWNTNTQTHDGYPGYNNEQLFRVAALPSFSTYTLVHAGTNNMSETANAEVAPAQLDVLLRKLLENNLDGKIIVARIISMRNGLNQESIDSYNDSMCATINKLSTDRVMLIDMSNLLDSSTDYSDDIHPNDSGYNKMAKKWISAIKGFSSEVREGCSLK